MKIRADLHSHTNYSRDSVLSPEAYVRAYVRRGIDFAAVTDHNEIEGAFYVQELVKRMDAPLRIIVGEEVKTAEGEIIGLFLKELVPRGMSPEDTVKAIHDQGGIATIPHPFDTFRRSVLTRAALGRVAPSVQAIEGYNCRNILGRHDAAARDVARENAKPITVGSDSHSAWEVGGVSIEIDDFRSPEEFLAALPAGTVYFRRALPVVHWISTYAKIRWRLGFRPTHAPLTAATG
jgi:predicted metal-dependent phosphoesterase TrpH